MACGAAGRYLNGVSAVTGPRPLAKEPRAMLPTRTRNRLWGTLALAVCALLVGAPAARTEDPKVTEGGDSVKGDVKDVMDLKVTPVKLRANVLGCLFWADRDGTGFWTLDPVGTLRLISFPDLKETRKIEIDKKCSWAAPSAEGLVVSVTETQEVW